MSLATDIFCTLGQCWIGEGIDGIYVVATTLLEIAIKLSPMFGVMYFGYWLFLVIRTVREGSPEPIMNHIMFVWQVITGIVHAFMSFIKLFIP
jgi:hypothetical protein